LDEAKSRGGTALAGDAPPCRARRGAPGAPFPQGRRLASWPR